MRGDVSLPSLAEQEAHTAGWMEKQTKLVSDEDYIRFQQAHIQEIGDDVNAPDVNVCDIFLEWEKHGHDEIMTHRNKSFASIFGDKQVAAAPAKPWMECFHPRDYLGEELSKQIKLDDWILEVGGEKYETVKRL